MFNMVTRQVAWSGERQIEDEPELHVVAFYEDLRTGEWAKEIFDRIRSRAPRDTTATPGLWRFDALEDEHLGNIAAADAANAAVIIVATQGNRPLPRRLLECVEKALIKKGPARVGLVAILEQTEACAKESLPAYRQLQAISRKARLRFFSLPCRNVAQPVPTEESFRFAAGRFLDNSLSVEIRTYRAWGINE
jgi:hypothetical protein